MNHATATRKLHILLVDDDEDFALQQRLVLEALGHRVTCARSAREGREAFHAGAFDAAVLDLMMEDADSGFVLARDLKAAKPGLPVVMVSAVTAETGLEFAAEAGRSAWVKADAILTKPVRPEQLVAEIARRL